VRSREIFVIGSGKVNSESASSSAFCSIFFAALRASFSLSKAAIKNHFFSEGLCKISV